MLHLSLLLELVYGFLGAIEVAAIRSLCKTAMNSVEYEPEGSFNFTLTPVVPLLSKFTLEAHLLWVVDRMNYDEFENGLVNRTRIVWREVVNQHYRPRVPWRCMGNHLQAIHAQSPGRVLIHRNLEILVRAFWFHPVVQDLRATAFRLDSIKLLMHIAREAPGPCYLQLENRGLIQSDGYSNFLYNCWVFIEEAWQKEHGPWTSQFSFPRRVGKVQLMLWTFMKDVRHLNFRGYSFIDEYHIDDEELAEVV